MLQGLMADRAWELPAAGGSILDHWPDIAAAVAPQLPSHVDAVAFHPETRQLDLRPDSPAYATQLRLITARIIAAANETTGTNAVRTVRVLPAGAAPAPAPRQAQPAPAAAATSEAPVKTRENASPGYQAALAAHQAVAPQRRTDTAIAQALERQNSAMRELSRQAFSEPETAVDDAPTAIEAARVQRRRQAAVTEATALRRARAERAARQAGTQAVVPQRAPLRTTA